ncbi:hypothetical protein LCGC14_2361020, partial [marine sediment metagenome]
NSPFSYKSWADAVKAGRTISTSGPILDFYVDGKHIGDTIQMGNDGGTIEIWGDGKQTRSFLCIDECIEGIRRLMESDFEGPINIGSEEMVTINQLAEIIMKIAKKRLWIRHIPGPLGVRGRNSNNRLILDKLQWKPSQALEAGLTKTYFWIKEQITVAKRRGIKHDHYGSQQIKRNGEAF